MGMMKPDPDIYLAVLNDLACRPDEAVFIDDKTENVEAARQLGMRGIVFRGVAEVQAELCDGEETQHHPD
jgi:putative hydrolase of the HAD superfamily